MTKTANLYARIEPNLKTEAEGILSDLGIPVSKAINIFYWQIVIHRGLPFEVKLTPSPLVNCATLTNGELDAEIQRGLDDVAYAVGTVCRPYRRPVPLEPVEPLEPS